MDRTPLMPKATAVWLVDNTSLSFEQIAEFCRTTRVMMLSIFDSPEYVQRALDVGAAGYVLKDAVGNDLLAGVRALSAGKRYFSRPIAQIAETHLKRSLDQE